MGDDLSRERGKKDKKRMRLRGIEPLIYTEKNKKNAIFPTTVS